MTTSGRTLKRSFPGYEYLISWKDLYSTYGDFTDFTNNLVGSYSFVGELFQVETETFDGTLMRKQEERSMFGESSDAERQRLLFNDNVVQGEQFVEWKPFKHPLYGDIEVGGWTKMSSAAAASVHAAGPGSQECLGGYLHGAVHSEGDNGCVRG